MTPVKDEAWIIERFLACASLWADEIIVADQGSTDGSRQIAEAHPKVRLVGNGSGQYNEAERQHLLVAAAREIPGPRLLIALDADEALTANVLDSPEWTSALRASPGTVLDFEWVNLHPDGERCWIPDRHWSWGYMDDGAPHVGRLIHSPRVPLPPGAPRLRLHEVKVLHYAYTDRDRVRSRNRWYQCWEILNGAAARPTEQYRQYHQVGDDVRLLPRQREWTDRYQRAGIDMTTVNVEGRYRWDRLVLEALREHGAAPFRRVDLWDVDWPALAKLFGESAPTVPPDPRSMLDRMVLRYLRRTQGRQARFPWFHVDRALAMIGW